MPTPIHIGTELVAQLYPDVPIMDQGRVAQLATVFMGLTAIGSNDRECQRFAISTAIRILAEVRMLVKVRGL